MGNVLLVQFTIIVKEVVLLLLVRSVELILDIKGMAERIVNKKTTNIVLHAQTKDILAEIVTAVNLMTKVYAQVISHF